MVIFGTGSKNLGVKKLQGVKCENCESTDMHIQSYAKYFDIFWIPVFPYSKKYFSICGHCKQALETKEMSNQLKEKISLHKSEYKTPWYLFSGLFIIVAGISSIAYSANVHEKEVDENITHLMSNDILVFKERHNEFSFVKVTSVKNDTIYVNSGNYIYEGTKPTESDFKNKKRGVTDFFSSETRFFLQTEIDSLYSKETIVDIFK